MLTVALSHLGYSRLRFTTNPLQGGLSFTHFANVINI